MDPFEIFATAPPGLEKWLLPEFRALGYKDARYGPGGVTLQGTWHDVWRLNMELRGATSVLARIGTFRAMSLAGLAHRLDEFDWRDIFASRTSVRVEATCKRSKIYHEGAAVERVEKALRQAGMAPSPNGEVTLKLRIEQNICTLSIDTSGDSLHKRGYKEAVGKAPLRETMAALFLRQAGFDGTQTVVDPMCGSGTFLLEAAGIAAGHQPGRDRPFAFERLATYDEAATSALRRPAAPLDGPPRFFGSDRDAGAIKGATANAIRAGVAPSCSFANHAVSDAKAPEGPPGLVMINPPYGGRVGDKKQLFALYGALGKTLKANFAGWKVAFITSEPGLAKATALKLDQGPKVPHGGLNIWLFQAQL